MIEQDDTTFDGILKEFSTITDTLTLFKMQISTLQQHVKNVEKNVKKHLKNYVKNKQKDELKPKRQPSGFAKPTEVTSELCEFMNKPIGTKIARTEVNKTLSSYIKEHNLLASNKDNKQKIIIPDEKLKNLLQLNKTEMDNLTYFNIQKHMNKHFSSNKNISNETTNQP
jgi:chromatin remodeling complex protein RSC6